MELMLFILGGGGGGVLTCEGKQACVCDGTTPMLCFGSTCCYYDDLFAKTAV
jgi:hypothetical protein